MLLQILPTDLIAVRIIPLLSLVDKLALYDTNRLLRSLLPNFYKIIYETTLKNLKEWSMKSITEWSYPEEARESFNEIILPICTIKPDHRKYFDAFYKLIYNMHYFYLIHLNNTVYRMGQKEIIESPYRDYFLQVAMTVYIGKYKEYIELIENEVDAYMPVVLLNRIIPEEIKIRQLAGSYIDLKEVKDYEEVSSGLAAAIVVQAFRGKQLNYQFRHSFDTQEEKLQPLLKGMGEDVFMRGMGVLMV